MIITVYIIDVNSIVYKPNINLCYHNNRVNSSKPCDGNNQLYYDNSVWAWSFKTILVEMDVK